MRKVCQNQCIGRQMAKKAEFQALVQKKTETELYTDLPNHYGGIDLVPFNVVIYCVHYTLA